MKRAAKKLFDTAVEHIESGLDAPFVCVSYGGDPARLDKMPGYARLKQTAEAKGVTVLASEMSLTAGVNIGGGGCRWPSPHRAKRCLSNSVDKLCTTGTGWV